MLENILKKKIPYSTVEYQIKKLKTNHLRIEDEEHAKRTLRQYGYSNLIKSYRDPYVIIVDDHKEYKSYTSFNQIVSLYLLDQNLRNNVMASMQDLEEYIKAQAADVLAKSFGTDPENYLNFRNFRDKPKKPEFSLGSTLKRIKNKLAKNNNDPLRYYREECGIVPPWILFKNIYFSEIINLIEFFKKEQQSELANRIYNSDRLNLSVKQKRMLLMDTLFISLEYRNLSAHGGRIYNHGIKANFRSKEIFPAKNETELSGLSLFFFLLSLISDHPDPFHRLKLTLEKEVNRHCSLYPQDVTYLGEILNIDIIPRNIVYISKNSKKYHCDPHCSGIHGAVEIDYQKAIDQGYTPCKKCVK